MQEVIEEIMSQLVGGNAQISKILDDYQIRKTREHIKRLEMKASGQKPPQTSNTNEDALYRLINEDSPLHRDADKEEQ
jgi:hypothetical protein